jgi:peptidoglycan/LPS O-acetylase OafA/YrhL
VWIVAQGTIMQAWNPRFLAWFGVGVVNGSLWTIPVEIAFYVTVPILYWLCRGRARGLTITLIVVAVGSFAILYSLSFWIPDTSGVAFMKKAVRISPLPWMGMFCLGALAQRYIHIIYPVVAGRLLLFLAIFVAAAVVGWLLGIPVLFGSGNVIGIVNYLTLCLLVLAAAYTGRELSDRVLMRNDLSYGTYIYHMPVFNVLIQIGIRGPIGLAMGAGLTFVLSALSWWLVEKPALRRRKSVLYAR